MIILGISAYYHDSAAVLIKNGQILAAAEEERFTRIKHDNNFPYKAINYCLQEANIPKEKIDIVSYYEKPLLKFERLLDNFVVTYPFSLKPFIKGIPEWFGTKIKVEKTIRKTLSFKKVVYFVPHHLSHAAAAFFSSPYKNASILTIDGVGEYQTTVLWNGKNKQIMPIKSINFPHSLGLLYSTFTSFLGFKVNEDEYKLMGLAAYGKPIYVNQIKKTISLCKDGSFNLNLKYFSFRESFKMWSRDFENLFGRPRSPKGNITKRDEDLAASIQEVVEEIYFKTINYLYTITENTNLCLSGGVALNSLANGQIYTKTRFKNVFVFGPAGDNGSALGAALYIYYSLSKKTEKKPILSLYFGSEYDNDYIRTTIKQSRLKYRVYKKESQLLKKTANLLKKEKVVGWFQGRMEYGPRALGNRSILANPNNRYMKTKVNAIKKREQFRPFAGSILQKEVHKYFNVPIGHFSPFMTFCFQAKKENKNKIMAIIHIDNTCRIQTVNKTNGIYYRLIEEFYKQTGIACVLNTSFNLRGEPIVESPEQAIKDFIKTKMDYLVLNNCLIEK